jgi:hypothetical protein
VVSTENNDVYVKVQKVLCSWQLNSCALQLISSLSEVKYRSVNIFFWNLNSRSFAYFLLKIGNINENTFILAGIGVVISITVRFALRFK